MELKLLEYQETAVKSIVNVFDGNDKNTFDNACTDGIRANYCTLSNERLAENIKSILLENRIDINDAKLEEARELTIEMETGTGKTLVYIKSIYEMFKHYGFTKFIIFVPNGFKLNYTLTKQEQFAKNEILLATDGDKEALICLDGNLAEETVAYFKKNTEQKLIVLERALDTTKKWNLKHFMKDNFKAF